MSVFSKIKRSRQSAREHQQKEADKARKEAENAPYRHTPTHAAIDALNGAPPSWKNDDRDKILEQNRRRSAMAASGRDMRMPGPPSITGIPRVASSLSYVSYPSMHANPVGNMPRAYSYSGVPPLPPWDRGMELMYSLPGSVAPSIKGKEAERLPTTESGRQSSASSKGSPLGSSGDSSSSQDDLEIRPSFHRHSTMPQSVGMSPLHQTASSRPTAHRLHPSSRRASDASERGSDPAVVTRAAAASSFDRRPPAAMMTRGYGPLPALNPFPPVQAPSCSPGPENAVTALSTASIPSQKSLPTAHASLSSFNFGTDSTFHSPAGDPGLVSTKSSLPNSAPHTPTSLSCEEPAWEAITAPDSTVERPKKERRVSKTKVTRFTELETIDSNVEQPMMEDTRAFKNEADQDVVNQQMVRQKQTQELPVSSSTKSKRLYKPPPRGAKLTKKNRSS